VDLVFTKAYLRNLIKAKENLGIQIATIHNLAFYLQLMKQARKEIIAGTFSEWKDKMIPKLNNRL
jgi:queuine tRNA-ribosyltransferase